MPALLQLVDIRNNILCLRFEQMKKEYQKLLNIDKACATLKSHHFTKYHIRLKLQILAHEMQQLLQQDTDNVLPEEAVSFQQILQNTD